METERAAKRRVRLTRDELYIIATRAFIDGLTVGAIHRLYLPDRSYTAVRVALKALRGKRSPSPTAGACSLRVDALIARRHRALAERNKVRALAALPEYVAWRLRLDWSPETIIGRARRHGHALPRGAGSKESIYGWSRWDNARPDGERAGLWERLPHQLKRRRRGLWGRDRAPIAPGFKRIEDRPAVASASVELGHVEADTMRSVGSRHALVTSIDKACGEGRLTLVESNTAENFRRAIKRQYGRRTLKTLTLDRGAENAQWKAIEKDHGARSSSATLILPGRKAPSRISTSESGKR